VECRSGQTTLTCQAENISISGLLIRTGDPFSQDEEITVRFSMPASGSAIECRARVAHVVPEAFMGIQFMDLSPELTDVIEKHVSAAPALQASDKQS